MRPGLPAIPGAFDAMDGTARYRWPMGAHSFTLVPAAYLLMLRQSRESAQQPLRTRALEQRVDFFFTARRWSGEPTAAEPEKNMGMRWFALDELPEMVPPHERAVLDLLAGQLDGGRPVPAITTFGFAPGERVAAYGVARPH